MHRPDLVASCLGQYRNGRRDPTTELSERVFRRATWTPDGPGVLDVEAPLSATPVVTGHGPGGEWLCASWSRLRGDLDRIPDIEAVHHAVERAASRWAGLALGASGTPYHELLPAVLGQRITSVEAHAQWRRLVEILGEPAPDPAGTLVLPPAPERLAGIPYHELHRFGIEKKRADTLREVARNAHWLLRDWSGQLDRDRGNCTESLQRIRGIGPWTAAVAGGAAFGDPDALQVGDFHVKNTVAWALEGRPRGTDDEMVASLACYHGQRHRVVRWLELDGWRAPARGPRRRNLSIARL